MKEEEEKHIPPPGEGPTNALWVVVDRIPGGNRSVEEEHGVA